jgi:hypothetical protein
MNDLTNPSFTKLQTGDAGQLTDANKRRSVELLESKSLQLVDEFPAFEKISHGDLLSLALSTNTTGLTHGLHRFPAKYIPQVPRWAIRQFANLDSVVLDPFMGSGTSLVEGLCAVHQTYGVDIDPLAQLISRAKTNKYNMTKLNHLSKQILKGEMIPEGDCFLPMSGVKNITHWFSPVSWQELSKLFTAIDCLKCSDEERDFFFCVFSSILRWVSNADDQTQKTYVSGTLVKHPPPVWETFKKFLTKALAGVTALEGERTDRNACVLEGTALSIPLANSSVDLVVTSPPYLDSVDYMYNFMLEYFWLGPKLGVDNRPDYNLRRRTPVGAKNPLQRSDALPAEIAEIVDIESVPAYRREAVLSYFSSMQAHFIEAARVMKDNARYVLVVGNSQGENGVIAVHDCLLRLARSSGLHLEKAFAYRIRRHYMKFPRKGRGGIILMDWVITLKKSEKPIMQNEDRLPIPNITIGNDEVAH